MQDKPEYEKEWQHAFNEELEAPISENVWNKIELGIANASNTKMKRHVVLLQLLAAASVAIALGVSGIYTYQYFSDRSATSAGPGQRISSAIEIPAGKENPAGNRTDRDNPINRSDQDGLTGTPNSSRETPYQPYQLQASTRPGNETDDTHERVAEGKNIEDDKITGAKADQRYTPIAAAVDARLAVSSYLPEEEVDMTTTLPPSELELNSTYSAADNITAPLIVEKLFEFLKTDSLSSREMEMVPWYAYVPVKNSKDPQDLWAGVAFSAGRFDPQTGGMNNSPEMAQMAFDGNKLTYNSTPSFSDERVGQSINVGLNVGTRVADRWVVQGGVGYLQQQTTSTSNVVSSSPSITKVVQPATTFNSTGFNNIKNSNQVESLEFTVPYEIENTYELVSVPIQAGYILLDKKLNITLLTGVANNILLRNTFGTKTRDFESQTIRAGEKSLYRTYQISGLLGSEISYSIDQHYIVSLLPQVRQSLSSITKSGTDFESYPTIMEVGFRLKYIFH